MNFLTATVIQPSNCTAQPYLKGMQFLGAVSDRNIAVQVPLQRPIPAQETAEHPDVG